MQNLSSQRVPFRQGITLAGLLIERGHLFILIGAFDRAENDYQRAFRDATCRNSPIEKNRVMLEIANIAYLKGQFQKSLSLLNKIGPSIKRIQDSELTFLFWRYKGNTYRIQGNYAAALGCYEKLLSERGATGRDKRAIALNLTGLAHQGEGAYGKAAVKIRRAYRLFKDMKNYSAQGSCLANIGYVLTFSGKAEKALPCFEEAVAQLSRLGAKSLVATPLLNWGSAFYKLGRYDDALEKWQEALNLNREIGDFAAVAMLHNNIGFAFIEKKCCRESLKHFTIALAKKQELRLTGYLPSTYNGFAKAYYNLYRETKKVSHRKKALECARTAYKIAEKYSNTYDSGIARELIKKLKRSLNK